MCADIQFGLFNPGPVITDSGTRAAAVRLDVCHRGAQFGELMARVRVGLAGLCALPEAECVLLPGSASYALESVFSTIVRSQPHPVRSLTVSNGVYGDRLHQFAAAYSNETRCVDVGFGDRIEPGRVAQAIAEFAPDVVSVVHHETSTGMLNDIGTIADLAARAGAQLIVDAVSSIGAEEIPLSGRGSYLVGTANKCLEGLPGLGFVLASRSDLETLRRDTIPLTLNLRAHFEAQRAGTVLFTPPTNIVAALDHALTLLAAETVPVRGARYRRLLDEITGHLAESGMARLIPPDLSGSSLAAYRLPAQRSYAELEKWCAARDVQIYHGQGRTADTHLRLSTMGQLTDGHVAALLDAITEFAADGVA